MKSVNLAKAKSQLSALIDEAAAGETVCITKRGKAVAQITAIRQASEPVDVADLRALTDEMPFQEQSAGEFIRQMRDTDRY